MHVKQKNARIYIPIKLFFMVGVNRDNKLSFDAL
jgi:hypothetical protein